MTVDEQAKPIETKADDVVSCARHPDRKVAKSDPEGEKWLTMQTFGIKGMVVTRYCPECRGLYEAGRLI